MDQKYLHDCFDYDSETGELFWKLRPRSHFNTENGMKIHAARFAGRVAGTSRRRAGKKNTYLSVGLGDKRGMLVHRIIWCMAYGECPDIIDHIDGDGTNNRIENLRSVSNSVNLRNTTMYATNTSGITGVAFRKDRAGKKNWLARIMVNKKSVQLGYFYTEGDAASARLAAEMKYGFTERHGKQTDMRQTA